MNILSLTSAFLKNRPLVTVLNILLFALAIAVLVVLAKLDNHVQHRLEKDAAGIDMVVGAKGSPLQLVLSTVYHIDVPPGNIPLGAVSKLAHHKYVKEAVPISLGDSYYGCHIVGTRPQLINLYGAKFASGGIWQRPMEAVLGAEVAARSGLKVGDTFAGSHGLVSNGAPAHVHSGHPYKVVGILAKRGNIADRLVFTSLNSVWEIHGQEEAEEAAHPGQEEAEEPGGYDEPSNLEVTAVLIHFTTPIAAVAMPREINTSTAWQAALPAMEIARLVKLVGFGMNALRAFGILLLGISTLSLFVMLVSAMQRRKYDLAVMRSLGASRLRVSGQIICESLAITCAGLVAGFALGYGLTALLPDIFGAAYLSGMNIWEVVPLEYGLAGIALAVALVATIIPAWQAYRTDVHRLLMGS